MKVETTTLDGVLLITPPTIFEDFRGNYIELYNEVLYREAGINQVFLQDDISTSHQHVLRGIHGDRETWKLVSCLYGEFHLVVLDWREDSRDFRKWQGFRLSAANHQQVLIPPGFGNGHVVLSQEAIFHYKQTSYYNRAGQFTVLWNDPGLGIAWPVADPVLSPRDQGLA